MYGWPWTAGQNKGERDGLRPFSITTLTCLLMGLVHNSIFPHLLTNFLLNRKKEREKTRQLALLQYDWFPFFLLSTPPFIFIPFYSSSRRLYIDQRIYIDLIQVWRACRNGNSSFKVSFDKLVSVHLHTHSLLVKRLNCTHISSHFSALTQLFYNRRNEFLNRVYYCEYLREWPSRNNQGYTCKECKNTCVFAI